MTTPQQVKQALELALSLATTLESMTKEEANEIKELNKHLNLIISNIDPAIYEVIGEKTWQERYHGLNQEFSEQIGSLHQELRTKNEALDRLEQQLEDMTKPEEVTVKKTLKHPVDALLKKGKVKLKEGRYKQLVQIYNELTLTLGNTFPPEGLKFLSAHQNDHLTWFPLSLNGNKSAALYLAAEWEIAPISPKAEGILSGAWEDFDLNQAMEDTPFDQDDY